MNTNLESLDLTCGGQFAVPAFDLHARASALLRALHERSEPTFSIRESDVQVRGGTHLSDALVSIGLESKEGHVEISAHRLLVTFEEMSKWSELLECQACIALIHEVAIEALSIPPINDIILHTFIPFRVEGVDGESRDFLANQIAFDKCPTIEHATLSPGLYLNICGPKFDQWHGHLRISKSDMNPSFHFADFHMHYQPECATEGFAKRFKHFEELLRNLLEQMDIVLANSSTMEVQRK